jgi:hypothetical protein
MRYLLFILFSALLIPSAAVCQDRFLYLSPLLSYDNFRTPGFDYGFDFGAGASARISPAVMVSASVAFGRRSLAYDVVGGSGSLSAGIFALGGSLEILFLGRAGGTNVAATFGGGKITVTIDARTVSLGALGSITIPSREESRGFLQAGLAGEVPISPNVGFVILPSVRLFTPLSQTADLSLAGGLRVGIL